MSKFWLVSCRDFLVEVEGISFDGTVFRYYSESVDNVARREEVLDLSRIGSPKLHPLDRECTFSGPEGVYHYVTGVFTSREDAIAHAKDNLQKELDLIVPEFNEDAYREVCLGYQAASIKAKQREIAGLYRKIEEIRNAPIEPKVKAHIEYYSRRRADLLKRLGSL